MGREWPSWMDADLYTPHYLIAYTRPESPEGSCHQIKITVNRRNAAVDARSEYCNTKHSPSDPLNGTDFGKLLESNLASAGDHKIELTILAIAFYSDSHAARVHIALDWKWNSLKPNSQTVGSSESP